MSRTIKEYVAISNLRWEMFLMHCMIDNDDDDDDTIFNII